MIHPLPDPQRLLLVVDSLEVGGGERHTVDLAVALHRRGYRVTVACSRNGPLGCILQRAGVPAVALMEYPVKRRISVTYGGRLRRLLLDGEFGLVHAHMYASAAAATIATAGGVPLVITEHSEATWRCSEVRLACRSIYRRAGRLIAVSEPIRRRLVDEDRVPVERVRTIPNAVPPAARLARARRRRDGQIIGVVARLQPEKGLQDFLEAASLVSASIPNCRFVVAGDGPLAAALRAQSRRLGLEDRVQFLGGAVNGRVLVESFDILAVPSHSEGSPLVVLEAMVAGVPVVASAVGGITAQIEPEISGLLVPPASPSALAAACVRLLRDRGEAARIGWSGRQRAEALFDHETMVTRTEAVYCAATAAARRPDGGAAAQPRRRWDRSA